MKKIIIFIIAMVLFSLIEGCKAQEKEEGLYTKDDIFLDCKECGYIDGFTGKILIIEDEEGLEAAFKRVEVEEKNGLENKFIDVSLLPNFIKIKEQYDIREYSYVIQYIETSSKSTSLICDGIVLDKKNKSVFFKTSFKGPDEGDCAMNGYVVYAVFPKDELEKEEFSRQENVFYPGK